MPIVIFRPGGVYGPGDTRFLKLFRGVKKHRFIMLGSGDVCYQLVYIDDLVDGILLCGERENASGQVYILTGEDPVTLNRFVSLVAAEVGVQSPPLRLPVWPVYLAGAACEAACRLLGIQPPLYRRRIDFFVKTRWFDISKAKRDLGYQPKISLPEGLHSTAEWYRQAGML